MVGSEQNRITYETLSARYLELHQTISPLTQNERTVKKRIDLLLDKDSPIIELSTFASYKVYPDIDTPSAGIVTLIGKVTGIWSVVVANDPGVKGGTYFPLTVKKHLRAQSIALQNRLPCFYLVDSGGAFLPLQADTFADRDHFGRIFYNQARLSAAGIPQIAVVLGSCTAGGAYIPAMSDEVIMVRGKSTIFLGGPPLVKAATGEEVTAEELGGADVHCTKSGVGDYFTDSEDEALQTARSLLRFKKKNNSYSVNYHEPKHDPKEIYSLIESDSRRVFDVREIIIRLIDDSNFQEFKRFYAPSIVCGTAEVGGHSIGVVANNGILFSESALKATHFISLCCKRQIPLLFLQNIVGFMVGKKFEHEGIAKHGAKLVSTVANANVPKITIIIGGSYGAGNYAMCGRAYEPNFLFTWPNARTAIMGGEQAGSVMRQLEEGKARRAGKVLGVEEGDEIARRFRSQFLHESDPLYSSARLWDDGIVDPLHTRSLLKHLFAIVRGGDAIKESHGILRM
jgi:3-methylcrotonyl-CoA carboxylase beta subunit